MGVSDRNGVVGRNGVGKNPIVGDVGGGKEGKGRTADVVVAVKGSNAVADDYDKFMQEIASLK